MITDIVRRVASKNILGKAFFRFQCEVMTYGAHHITHPIEALHTVETLVYYALIN